jgi:hypothetical protein
MCLRTTTASFSLFSIVPYIYPLKEENAGSRANPLLTNKSVENSGLDRKFWVCIRMDRLHG